MQNGAELAAADHVAQLDHFPMEAAVVADRERHAGFAHGRDRVFGFALGERERLLAIDVLLGGSRRHHLRCVHGMRRRQHHRVDAGVMQHVVVARRQVQAFLLGEGFDLRGDGTRRARHELNDVAVLGRFHQRLAPPAKTDDTRFDHALCSATHCSRLRLCVAGTASRDFLIIISAKHHLGHVRTARATQASVQNTQYSMPPITQIHFLVTFQVAAPATNKWSAATTAT